MVDYTNEINGGVQDVLDFYVTGQEANEAQPWYNDIEAMQFPNVSIFFHMQTFKPELQWDLGQRPYNANNPDAKSQGISGEEFAWGYVIPSGVPEEKREAAFEWIKKITYEEDAAGWFMIQQSRPSPIRAETKTRSITRRILPGTKCLPRWVTMCLSHLPEHVRVRDIVNQAVEAAMFGPLRRPKRRSTTPLSKRRPYSTSSGVHRNDSAVLAWGGPLWPAPDRDRARDLLGFVFIAPWLVSFLLFDLMPIVSGFYHSFTNWNALALPTSSAGRTTGKP